MDKIESLNHTKWDCKYHVVFIPKNRQKCCMGDCVGIWEMYFGVWHSTRRVE
jgi:REP element-mobilizing transposase RayT